MKKKKNYNELIGNISELYEPDLAPGNLKWYSTTSSSGETQYTSVPNYPSSDPSIYSHIKPQYPSIPSRRIRVPLQFWFCQNSGLAIPLVALQYHDIYINIELRAVKDLYTIISHYEVDKKAEFSPTGGGEIGPNNLQWVRTAPNTTKSTHYIGNFLPQLPSLVSTSNDMDKAVNTLWELNPNLEVNYIYLDTEERKKFALSSHEYLITQVQFRYTNGVIGRNMFNIDFNNPVKEIIWVAKRDDINTRNDWNNYTNWLYTDIPISSNNNCNPYFYGNTWDGGSGIVNHPFNYFNMDNESDYQTKPYPFVTKTYEMNFIKNISTSGVLFINNSQRFPETTGDFFYNLQPYQYHNGSSAPGINIYSFSLEPDKYQPSGTCNFSRINKAGLYCNLLPPPFLKTLDGDVIYFYAFDVNIYAPNYNILRIMGGMAGIGFSS